VRVPAADLWYLEGSAGRLQTQSQVAVLLRSGAVVQGRVLSGSASKDNITVETVAAGILTLNADSLRLLRVRQPGGSLPRADMFDDEREAVYRPTPLGLDPVFGILHSVSKEGVLFEWGDRGKPDLFPWDKVAGFKLAAESDPAPPEAETELVLLCSDGCRLQGKPLAVVEGKLKLQSRELGELSVSLDRILAGHVEDRSTRLWLSAMEPKAVEERNFLDNPHLRFSFRRNENVMGDELQVTGRYWTAGLGCHSLSRLTYQVPANATTLVCLVAADDCAVGEDVTGEMDFRVKIGDRVLQEAAGLRGGQPAQPIRVDVKPGELLTLELDFAQGKHFMRGRGDWLAAAFLIKP
jgi:hypothetical protein